MGKNKSWNPEEHEAVAQAWINASEDLGSAEVNGTNQEVHKFFLKVMENLKTLAPKNEDILGRYHQLDASAVQNQWNTKIAREVRKFNKALLKVLASKPTGVSDNNKINMAAAIHLNKTDLVSYRHKDYPAEDWKFYRAWLILKDHKMFSPPKPPNDD